MSVVSEVKHSPRLLVIRGLPGSGKSTKARSEYPDYLHYEPDHLFCDTAGRYRFDLQLWDKACRWVWTMADFALARGERVVVTDVFPRLAEIEPYRQLAVSHGADFAVITCSDSFGDVHQVPVTVLDEMRAAFEVYDGAEWSEQ